jgi:hypothetical protein
MLTYWTMSHRATVSGTIVTPLFKVTKCRHIACRHPLQITMVTVLFNVPQCRHIGCQPEQRYLVTMVTDLII